MLNLDSIKLKMQLEDLDFDSSLYDRCIKEREFDTWTQYQLRHKPIGVSSIVILPTNNEVLVQCSAKVLGTDYLQGINKNTLEQLHIGLKPYIRCSLSDIESSLLLRGDITENLYFNNRAEKEDAIFSLKLGKSNTGFKIDDHTDKRESIIFTGRQTSYKNRQIYYNKEKELMLSKNKHISNLLNWRRDRVENILRVEQNIVSFEKLRQAIGQKSIPSWSVRNGEEDNSVYLRDVLNSDAKPLHQRHLKIMEYANQVCLFDEYERFEDAIFDYGIRGIYAACNSSVELVMDFLKEKTKKYEDKNGCKYFSNHFYVTKKKVLSHISNNIVRFTTQSVVNNKNGNEYFEMLKRVGDMLAA